LNRHQRFAGFLNRTFTIRPGIYDLIREDTVLCRCEEVTAGRVAAVASECQGSLRVIKQLTRAGMGPCQGRMCHSLVAQVASRKSGRSVEELGVDTPRAPIKPVPLEALTGVPV
jgi:NAD(P)H-nitrite reductase large subunit